MSHDGGGQLRGLAEMAGGKRRAQLHLHLIAGPAGTVGNPHRHEGQQAQTVLPLKFEEKLDEAVFAGTHFLPEVGPLWKQDKVGPPGQQRRQPPEGRQRRPGPPAVHRHPAPGPQDLPDDRLLKQLHLGDVVERRRQGHADQGDVLPALVLGADDGGAFRRQVFQAADLEGKVPPDGLPAEPAAATVEGGG